jgi:type VI protein secretion system component Hcp
LVGIFVSHRFSGGIMKTIFPAQCSPLKMLSAFILAVALIPSVAHADYFLQFDGIKGESTDKDHKDWINIESLQWGVTSTGSSSHGGGGGSGKALFQDFSWTQGMDKSFVGLFDNIANGNGFKKAVVDFQSNSEEPFVYFKMTFGDVFLSQVSLSGSGGEIPVVEGSFSYGQIKLEYWKLDAKGKRILDGMAEYDLSKGGSVAALAGLYARAATGPELAVPIPEPETYAMLMAGLGLLGVIAHRRQRVGTA